MIRLPKIRSASDLILVLLSFKVFADASILLPYSDAVDNILVFVSGGLLILDIIRKNLPKKILCSYILVLFLAFITAVRTGESILLLTILACMAMDPKRFNHQIRLIFTAEILMLSLHTIVAVLFHFTMDFPLQIDSRGEMRYHFGLIHPNSFSLYAFNLMLMWSWLNYEHIKTRHICVLFVIACFITFFTRTRTSLLCTFLFCAALFIVRKSFKKLNMLMNFCSRFIVPALAIFTMGCIQLYIAGNPFAKLVDWAITGRIHYGGYALTTYGYSLLGQPISFVGEFEPVWHLTEFTFDNIYDYLMIYIGAVWMVLLCVLFYLLVKRLGTKACPFVIAWALYGMTEVHGLNGLLCFPILLVVTLFNKNLKFADESHAA